MVSKKSGPWGRYLRFAQKELHIPLSVVSIIRGVDDPNANCIELRSLRRFASIRMSRAWFFCMMYCRRSLSASCIARLRSSTCERRSFSRRRRSSMRRRRSSSFCSRNFCAASACAFSSSSFRCRSSFWRSFICFIRSSRSFCRSAGGRKTEILFIYCVRSSSWDCARKYRKTRNQSCYCGLQRVISLMD